MGDDQVQALAQAPAARQAGQRQDILERQQQRGGAQADFQQRHLNQTRVFADHLTRYENGGWLARRSAAKAICSFFEGASKEETSSLIRSIAETHNPLAWKFMKKYGGGAGGKCSHLLLFQSLKVMDEHNADDIIALQMKQLSAEPDKTERFLEATMDMYARLENIFVLKSMNTVLEKVDARVRGAFVELHDLHGMAIPAYDDTRKVWIGKTVAYIPKGREHSTEDALLASSFHVKRARVKGMNFTAESWIVDINHVLETAVWRFFRKLYSSNWIKFTNGYDAPGVSGRLASLRSAAGWQGRVKGGLPYVLVEVNGQLVKIYVSLADMRADKTGELQVTYEEKTVDINNLSRIRSVEIPQEFLTKKALERITALAASSVLQQSQQLWRNEAVSQAPQASQHVPQFFLLHANQVFLVSTSNFGAGLNVSLSIFAHTPSLRSTTPKLWRGVNLFARVSGTGAVHETGSATGSVAYFDADFSSSGAVPKFSGGIIYSTEPSTVKKNVEEFGSDSSGWGKGARENSVASSAGVFAGAVSFVEGVFNFVSGSVRATGVSEEKLKALPGEKEKTNVPAAIPFSNAFKEKTPLSEAAHSKLSAIVGISARKTPVPHVHSCCKSRLHSDAKQLVALCVANETRARAVEHVVSRAGVRESVGARVANEVHVRAGVGVRAGEHVVLHAGVREIVGNVSRDRVHDAVRVANENVVLHSNVGVRVACSEIVLQNSVRESVGVSNGGVVLGETVRGRVSNGENVVQVGARECIGENFARAGVHEYVGVLSERAGSVVVSERVRAREFVACSEIVLSEGAVAGALQPVSASLYPSACVPVEALSVQAFGFELEQPVGSSVSVGRENLVVRARVDNFQVEVVRRDKVKKKILLKELKRLKVAERKENGKKKKLGIEDVSSLVRALNGKPPGGEGNKKKRRKRRLKEFLELLELLSERGGKKRERKWGRKKNERMKKSGARASSKRK